MSSNARYRTRILLLGSSLLFAMLFMPAAGSAAEPADGARSAHAFVPRPQIGRIFFSPAERRARRGGVSRIAPPPTASRPVNVSWLTAP